VVPDRENNRQKRFSTSLLLLRIDTLCYTGETMQEITEMSYKRIKGDSVTYVCNWIFCSCICWQV